MESNQGNTTTDVSGILGKLFDECEDLKETIKARDKADKLCFEALCEALQVSDEVYEANNLKSLIVSEVIPFICRIKQSHES